MLRGPCVAHYEGCYLDDRHMLLSCEVMKAGIQRPAQTFVVRHSETWWR